MRNFQGILCYNPYSYLSKTILLLTVSPLRPIYSLASFLPLRKGWHVYVRLLISSFLGWWDYALLFVILCRRSLSWYLVLLLSSLLSFSSSRLHVPVKTVAFVSMHVIFYLFLLFIDYPSYRHSTSSVVGCLNLHVLPSLKNNIKNIID